MSVLLPRESPPHAALPTAASRVLPRESPAEQSSRITIREVTASALSDHAGLRMRVRACIELGSLLPVDVVVDLVPSKGRPPGCRCRLFSVHWLGGGTYLFEGTAREDELRPDGFEIRVSPASGSRSLPGELPVVRRIALPR